MELYKTLGISYVIEHYIAYFKIYQEDKIFKAYVTDALKALCENTSKKYGGEVLSKRYIDIIEPPKKTESEDKDANEIILDFKEKLKRV